MSGEKKLPTPNIPFRITKTRLVLDVDLEKKALIGYVEHYITDISPNLKMINLHCAEQCEVSQAKVVSAIDKSIIAISKVRHQTFGHISESDLTRSGNESFCLEEFVKQKLTIEESIEDQGCLIILFENPIECENVILRLYFRVIQPGGGVFFYSNSDGEHYMYTHCQLKGARLWFPTMDNTNVFASYEFEITTNSDYYTVCSGKLVQQLQNSNGSLRTAFFRQSIPLAPQSVAIVIGRFDIYPKTFSKDGPDINYMTVFFPRNKFSDYQIKRTTKILEFVKNDVENFLSVNIVKSTDPKQQGEEQNSEGVLEHYAIVFLEEFYQPTVSYAGVSILSTDYILEPLSSVTIERNVEVWSELCYLFCRQLFGNFVVEKMWTDTWLLVGFAGWLTFHFQEKRFGKNAIRYTMLREIRKLKKMEEYNTSLCPVVTSKKSRENPLLRTEELSKEYIRRKSPLVIYMIGQHIRVETMGDVLQQIAVSAIRHGRRELSTKNFLSRLKRFENFDIKNFANYWIYGTGVLDLECGYEYDAKKNVVCLAIKQVLPHPAHHVFRGVMEVVISEKSGSYVKSVKMDKEYTYDEFVCRSKGIRKKSSGGRPKGKGGGRGRPPNNSKAASGAANPPIPLAEVKSPINSIRFDPGLKLLRFVSFPQPLSNLFELLHQGQDVETQCTAINTLVMEFPKNQMARHKVLEELSATINNPCIYHMVRIHALKGMVAIGLQYPEVVENVAKFAITFFKEKFYTKDNELKKNDFSDFDLYYLKKEIPYQLSYLRIRRTQGKKGENSTPSSLLPSSGNATEKTPTYFGGEKEEVKLDTPSVVVDLIWKIIKFNDNSENYFSDVFYMARVIQAIGNLSISDPKKKMEIYEFLQTKLVVDSLLPSYLYVNTTASLKGMTKFYLNVENFSILENHSLDLNFFRERLERTFPFSVRIIALKSILKLFSSPRLWGLPVQLFPSRPIPIRPPCPNGATEQVELFYHFFDHVLGYIYNKEESPYIRTKFLSILNRYFQLSFKTIVLLHRNSSGTPSGVNGNVTGGNPSTTTPTLQYTRKFQTSSNFSVEENGKSVLGEFLVRVATSVHPHHQKWVKKFWLTLRNERANQIFRIAVIDIYLTMFGYDATPVCMRNLAGRPTSRNPQHVIVPPPLQDIPKEGQIRIIPTTPMSPTTPFSLMTGTSYFPSRFGGFGGSNNNNESTNNQQQQQPKTKIKLESTVAVLGPEDQPLSMNRKRKWRNEGEEGDDGGLPLGDNATKNEDGENEPKLKRRKKSVEEDGSGDQPGIEIKLETNVINDEEEKKRKKKKSKRKKKRKSKKKKKKKKKKKMLDEDDDDSDSSSDDSIEEEDEEEEEEEEENIKMKEKKKKKKRNIPPPPIKPAGVSDGEMVVDRSYIFPMGGDEQSLSDYFRSVQDDDAFRAIFSYRTDFKTSYLYDYEHFVAMVMTPTQGGGIPLGFLIELYVQDDNFPSSSFVTAQEILNCLPIQGEEEDEGEADNKDTSAASAALKLVGRAIQGLAWLRLPDPPRVGSIPYGPKRRNKVYKSQKEIALWRPEDNKQYLVLGYDETEFYNDNESVFHSNIGFYNQRFSKIVFGSPLNVFGRIFKGHHRHVTAEGLKPHYDTSIISLNRPKRILFTSFRSSAGESIHLKCLEIDLYPSNPVADRFQEVLKRVSVSSIVLWFRASQSDVMYFSYTTLDPEGNNDERSVNLTKEYKKIATTNTKVCLRWELLPGEVAIDYLSSVIYVGSPILGKKVYKKKKRGANKRKVSQKPGMPSKMSYEVAVIGKVVSMEALEEFWTSPAIKCDSNGLTNIKMWVRERVIRVTIVNKRRIRADDDDSEDEEDEEDTRHREFLVELYNTVTSDLIYQALPIVTRVKRYENSKVKFVGLQLNSDFTEQFPIEPNVSDRRFKDDEFGLWKNGQMLVCCNQSKRGLPFQCNVWGRYRGVVGKMKIDLGDFLEDDIIRIERVTDWK